MARWRRETEEIVARELGGANVPWVEWDASLPLGPVEPPLVVNAVGHAIGADERARVLASLAAVFPEGGTLVVVDHNRPRRIGAAVAALVARPFVPGSSPAARWRRLADPAARMVQTAGFRVERLRLAVSERVQVVVATRTRVAAAQGSTTVDGTQRSRGPKNGN